MFQVEEWEPWGLMNREADANSFEEVHLNAQCCLNCEKIILEIVSSPWQKIAKWRIHKFPNGVWNKHPSEGGSVTLMPNPNIPWLPLFHLGEWEQERGGTGTSMIKSLCRKRFHCWPSTKDFAGYSPKCRPELYNLTFTPKRVSN